jgi:hypothetical protein
LIAEAVMEALSRTEECYIYDKGGYGMVTAQARQLVRERLKAFPEVCLMAQEATDTMKVVLDYEIGAVKNALTGISEDPYYQIVPDLYFHGLPVREVSYRANCEISTVRRHEERLLSELAFLLYGVAARWRHSSFSIAPPFRPEK